MDQINGGEVRMAKHLIVDATPGKRPHVVAWGLTDDVEIKRVVRLLRESRPHAVTIALLASDWEAFDAAHR